MKPIPFLLVMFFTPVILNAQETGRFYVDIRDMDVKAASQASDPSPGYKRVVFTRDSLDPTRDYPLIILPPDRFKVVKFRDGTALNASPIPSVMSVQGILEYLGYGSYLHWVNPESGTHGPSVDGAFGLATKKALEVFLGDVGWKQSPERVDLMLYTLLYEIYRQGESGLESLNKPAAGMLPKVSLNPVQVSPAPTMTDIPKITPPEPSLEVVSVSPSTQSVMLPDEMVGMSHSVAETVPETTPITPSDTPWTKILETWGSLGMREQNHFESLAREEIIKDGPNSALAIKILVKNGWTQNRKSLIKGTEGLWLPRRYWQN